MFPINIFKISQNTHVFTVLALIFVNKRQPFFQHQRGTLIKLNMVQEHNLGPKLTEAKYYCHRYKNDSRHIKYVLCICLLGKFYWQKFQNYFCTNIFTISKMFSSEYHDKINMKTDTNKWCTSKRSIQLKFCTVFFSLIQNPVTVETL